MSNYRFVTNTCCFCISVVCCNKVEMYGVLKTEPEEAGELVLLRLKAHICIISLHGISDKERALLGASNN